MQLQQARHTLHDLQIRILAVTFETQQVARAYAAETDLAWPILVDAGRLLYRQYGLQKAKLRHLWGPTTWIAYGKEAMRGRLPRWPAADPTQQGGDVLIDPTGIVRFHHVGTGPGDRPSVDDILSVRRSIATTDDVRPLGSPAEPREDRPRT